MKILPEQLSHLCRPFGNILSVVVLHGRGQALVEMDTPSAVDKFLSWSCSESEGDRSNTATGMLGDNTEHSVVSTGASCEFKLKFDSWSQCATVQKGRARNSKNGNVDSNNDSNSNDNHNINIISDNSSHNSSSSSINDSNSNNNDDNDKNINNSDNHININNNNCSKSNIKNIENTKNCSANTKNNRNQKILSDETIRLETSRCLAVIIKKIVYEDSECRMRERKLRKKNHEILLEGISRKRMKKENTDENNFKSIETDMAENSKKVKKNEIEKEKIPKSEFFLNDWRNNKYCLNKEELRLICWNYVASGGNIEFCPYYKQKVEENNQNSPNLPGKCPLFHVSRPVTELPINLRALEFEDFFPLARFVDFIFYC
jgi:hypothetical protein